MVKSFNVIDYFGDIEFAQTYKSASLFHRFTPKDDLSLEGD
jgi:hypothetical protein